MTKKFISTLLIVLAIAVLMSGCHKTTAPETAETTNQTESVEEEVVVEEVDEETVVEETVVEETAEEASEEVEEEPEVIMYFTEEDVIAMAKVLYSECRGIPSTMEQACVAWTACNRVDAGRADTILGVLTAPNQYAYNEYCVVDEELYNLALDVLTRWNNEKNGFENVGRVLPPDYLYFHGSDGHNWFRNAFSGEFDTWDYSLDNHYDS